ncbi:hypothetical protein C2E20_5497 [Micractinium conductrix]|uniref:Nucleotide-diphospho-sugar transferase domain-containing protein n=1 Tax=Micractinium conductrix TaxID=554055 RepID=A0A2P6VAQ1_9CHLO|nr:hypothetical protein C2E20_5497 [Micractinium conductrix]|eukprot:PSC71164.1 hypothetical protein C2E20_5497 [Micractinium conductrix]
MSGCRLTQACGLPYIGVHDFDALLELRAGPAGGYDKAIHLLPFGATVAEFVQNALYTLVKFAGVHNYLFWTWTAEALAACDELNLPCADGMPHLLRPAEYGHHLTVAMWLKPVPTLRALKRGVAVVLSDSDVAFTRKPIMDVAFQLAQQSHADALFQEEGPVNTGFLAVLPSERGLRFAEAWAGFADASLGETVVTDQGALGWARGARSGQYGWCFTLGECRAKRGANESQPLLRTVKPWNFYSEPDDCKLARDPKPPVIADVCNATGVKQEVLRLQRMWFMHVRMFEVAVEPPWGWRSGRGQVGCTVHTALAGALLLGSVALLLSPPATSVQTSVFLCKPGARGGNASLSSALPAPSAAGDTFPQTISAAQARELPSDGRPVQPVPPEPSQASYQRLQAAPALVSAEPALVAEFAAAPWLLPPNCSGLPYIRVHDFDALLELRAGPAGGYDKAIAILPFSIESAEHAQNALYSLVKFAGVHNYIFWTWTANALTACNEMNLPCADGRPHLIHPPEWGHAIKVAMWLKPVLTLRALKRGVAVMLSDNDVAFTRKPIMDLMLQQPSTLEVWAGSASTYLATNESTLTDQQALSWQGGFATQGHYWYCQTPTECQALRKQNESRPLVRTLKPWNFGYDGEDCRIIHDPWPAVVDPCDLRASTYLCTVLLRMPSLLLPTALASTRAPPQ